MKEQSVQAVSGIGRGRHTTRTISFLDLPTGGLLADTPGMCLPLESLVLCNANNIKLIDVPIHLMHFLKLVSGCHQC